MSTPTTAPPEPKATAQEMAANHLEQIRQEGIPEPQPPLKLYAEFPGPYAYVVYVRAPEGGLEQIRAFDPRPHEELTESWGKAVSAKDPVFRLVGIDAPRAIMGPDGKEFALKTGGALSLLTSSLVALRCLEPQDDAEAVSEDDGGPYEDEGPEEPQQQVQPMIPARKGTFKT